MKFIDDSIFIGQRVWSARSVYSGCIIWSGRHIKRFRGGFRRITASRENKNDKKLAQLQTAVLANYSPKFRLLFTIFKF